MDKFYEQIELFSDYNRILISRSTDLISLAIDIPRKVFEIWITSPNSLFSLIISHALTENSSSMPVEIIVTDSAVYFFSGLFIDKCYK